MPRAKPKGSARKRKGIKNPKTVDSKPPAKILLPVPDVLEVEARYGPEQQHPWFWPTMEARGRVARMIAIADASADGAAIPTLAEVAIDLDIAGTDHAAKFWRGLLRALVDRNADWFRTVAKMLDVQSLGPRHSEPYWLAKAVFFLLNSGLDWKDFTKEILRKTALRMWALHDAAVKAAPSLGNRFFQPGPLMQMNLSAVAKLLGRDDIKQLRRELNDFCSVHDGKAWQRTWKTWNIELPNGKAGRKRRGEDEFFPAEITDKNPKRRP